MTSAHPAGTGQQASMASAAEKTRKVLMELTKGTFVSQAISVFARLGVADCLAAGTGHVEDIARRSGSDAPTLHRLLRALSDMDIVTEIGEGQFDLAPMGELLRSDAIGSMHGLAVMVGMPFHRDAWTGLYETVRTGDPAFNRIHGTDVFGYLSQHPEEAAVFDTAMTSISNGMTAGIAAAYDFSRFHRIVDVGGGHGAMVQAILAAHTRLTGAIYDRPEVVSGTRDAITRAGLLDRCEVLAGDFLVDVPSDGDLYLLSNVIHDWDDETSVRILTNIRAALQEHERVLLVEPVLPDGPEPSFGKLLDLEMLVMTPGGRHRNAAEYIALLGQAGLTMTDVQVAGGNQQTSFVEAGPGR